MASYGKYLLVKDYPSGSDVKLKAPWLKTPWHKDEGFVLPCPDLPPRMEFERKRAPVIDIPDDFKCCQLSVLIDKLLEIYMDRDRQRDVRNCVVLKVPASFPSNDVSWELFLLLDHVLDLVIPLERLPNGEFKRLRVFVVKETWSEDNVNPASAPAPAPASASALDLFWCLCALVVALFCFWGLSFWSKDFKPSVRVLVKDYPSGSDVDAFRWLRSEWCIDKEFDVLPYPDLPPRMEFEMKRAPVIHIPANFQTCAQLSVVIDKLLEIYMDRDCQRDVSVVLKVSASFPANAAVSGEFFFLLDRVLDLVIAWRSKRLLNGEFKKLRVFVVEETYNVRPAYVFAWELASDPYWGPSLLVCVFALALFRVLLWFKDYYGL